MTPLLKDVHLEDCQVLLKAVNGVVERKKKEARRGKGRGKTTDDESASFDD